jgi:hypothetical protein
LPLSQPTFHVYVLHVFHYMFRLTGSLKPKNVVKNMCNTFTWKVGCEWGNSILLCFRHYILLCQSKWQAFELNRKDRHLLKLTSLIFIYGNHIWPILQSTFGYLQFIINIIIQTHLNIHVFCRYATSSVEGFLFMYIFNCISIQNKIFCPIPTFLITRLDKTEGDNTKGKN